jgi:hypothetical protein
MAPPPVSNNPLVSEHHAALVGLTGKLKTTLRTPQLLRLDKSSAQYAAAFAALVQEFGSASVSLNSDYYEDARTDAEVPGAYRVPDIEPLAPERVSGALTAALDAPPDLAQSSVEGYADLLVTSIGKNALIAAIMGDNKAQKWARVTSGKACAFCRMLATRGAVYKSDASASFVPHPRCHCTIEAVFHPESYEPTAATRSDIALYNAAGENAEAGDRLNAFRRALDAQGRGETPVFLKPAPLPVRPSQADLLSGLFGRIDGAMKPPA